MSHEIAKLILEHAGSFLDRTDAVETALGMGMPLDEIERYLDWLDSLKSEIGHDGDAAPRPSTRRVGR